DGVVQHAGRLGVVRAGGGRPPHPPERRAAPGELSMAIFSALSTFALRQVVGEGAENVVKSLGDRLSDQGRLLVAALEKASERACASAGRGAPAAVLDRERAALREVATALEKAGHRNLAWLFGREVQPGQSLLVLAVRFYFRRAVETTPELARGLQFSRMENL